MRAQNEAVFLPFLPFFLFFWGMSGQNSIKKQFLARDFGGEMKRKTVISKGFGKEY